jgi:hypothetical protein
MNPVLILSRAIRTGASAGSTEQGAGEYHHPPAPSSSRYRAGVVLGPVLFVYTSMSTPSTSVTKRLRTGRGALSQAAFSEANSRSFSSRRSRLAGSSG